MNDTTTKTTMRQLLARWAEVEPGRCHLKKNIDGFTINSGKWWDLLLTGNLPSEDGLMKLQWAVQQAIVARGWPFTLTYYSIFNNYTGEIDIDSHQSICREGDNPAEALLTCYLRALEY